MVSMANHHHVRHMTHSHTDRADNCPPPLAVNCYLYYPSSLPPLQSAFSFFTTPRAPPVACGRSRSEAKKPMFINTQNYTSNTFMFCPKVL